MRLTQSSNAKLAIYTNVYARRALSNARLKAVVHKFVAPVITAVRCVDHV